MSDEIPHDEIAPSAPRRSLDTCPDPAPGVQRDPADAETHSTVFGHSSTGEGSAHGMRLSEIQQQIGSGEYRVDTHAVADAIIRRLLSVAAPAAAPRSEPDPG